MEKNCVLMLLGPHLVAILVNRMPANQPNMVISVFYHLELKIQINLPVLVHQLSAHRPI